METRRIAIGEVELSYNEIAGAGRPLVMIHGLTGHRDDFRQRMPDLAGTGRVLVPDLRGHGDFTQTGRAETFRFERMVEDLRELLDAWEVERCDLLGHSFGGMVVLRFVLAYPERVASLILMDTAPFAPADYSVALFEKGGAIARERGMAFLQEIVEKNARAAESPSLSDRRAQQLADWYWPHQRLRYRAMDPVGYGALGRLMMTQDPVSERLSQIRCPTTVLVGADDEEFLAGADALSKGIAQAVRVTLAEAGHHPQMESSAAWLAAVRDHLARAGRE